jgi:glycosyltransferase involved in cell wall biosynthesis
MSLTTYDWAKHRRVKRAMRPIVAVLLHKLDGVVFASTGERVASEPEVWRDAKVVLHPSTAPENLGQDLPPVEYDVLFVGRIDPQKDLQLLLRSVAKSRQSYKVAIVGDGDPEYTAELMALSGRLGLSERVTWCGWRPHSEVQVMLRQSRVTLVTSLVENYCHSAIEGILAGTEVVLVDRVMSAADFAKLADVIVCAPQPEDVAAAVDEAILRWATRTAARIEASHRAAVQCSPSASASRLDQFAVDARRPSFPIGAP